MLHRHVRKFSACTLAYTRTCTVMYMSTGRLCIAPDTIAYAKVSGADRIAWRTQLHLTTAPSKVRQFLRKIYNFSLNF